MKPATRLEQITPHLLNPQESGLAFLPDQYCEDGKLARRSARRLLDLSFKTLVVSHGEPLTVNAKRQVADLLKSLSRRPHAAK